MEQPIAFILETTLNPGQQQAFQTLVPELIASAQAEPGTLSYEFFGNDDGTVVLFYERYANSAAVFAHLATFGQRLATRLFEIVTPTQLTVLGTMSDELEAVVLSMGPRYLHPLGSITR